MVTYKAETEIGGKVLKFETGKLAKLAAGAVQVTFGETVVLCTVVFGKPREGIDFFPLTVDYREKMYAAGKFPGGFFKREARPTQKEVLTMRLIDRPIRPMFPADYRDEVQIQAAVLSSDQENDPDVLAMCGASAALMVSSIPLEGPTAAVRVGRIDGEFIINPTMAQREESDLEVVLAGHAGGVNMIEAACLEVPEQAVADAIAFGYDHCRKVLGVIEELARQVARAKEWTPPVKDAQMPTRVRELCAQYDLRAAKRQAKKADRQAAVESVYERIYTDLIPEGAEGLAYTKNDVRDEIQKIEEELFVRSVLDEGVRSDGRGVEDLREITCEVSTLPRTHGSALFCRGETQSLCVITLGTSRDEQMVDDLLEEYSKKFMLHYNFPPFCTGEVKRIGAVSRREIGHGSLAERALQAVMPSTEKFPYTIRIVADILESNGSSSMASVCGGTLALMDGGVPIKHPVAGISIGMVHDGDRYALLTDILGEEDHFGDMDFKVAGTQVGITAVQLDLKTRQIEHSKIVEVLARAKTARMQILKRMLTCIGRPREAISMYAPRLLTIKIDPDKIGKLIGPGGKGIKALEAATGADIDIQDDGTVFISCVDAAKAQEAYEHVERISEGVKIGKIYTGKVISIKDFGAFIEVAPGQDGLCHISELSDSYVQKVGDVCSIGDTLRVKVIAIDEHGRVKLSRKQAMAEEPA